MNKEALLRQELTTCISFLSAQGWIPATSSNFSARYDEQRILISRSGVDKSQFREADIIWIDRIGNVVQPVDAKASAETLIHCTIYDHFPAAECVLHTHSISGAVLSRLSEERISFTGFEIQKALLGITSHETTVHLPILENDQDMKRFSNDLKRRFQEEDIPHGFLIRGHGLYSWGSSIAAAKRSIEALEFLMECTLLERRFR